MLDRLVVINGTDAEREHHLNFSDGPIIVGRSNAQARIVVPDLQVSRIHFQIEQRDGRPWVVDLNSSSGTLVNGRKVSTHQLQPGDTIRIGETQMRFVSAGVQHTAGEEPSESRLEDLVGTLLVPPADVRYARRPGPPAVAVAHHANVVRDPGRRQASLEPPLIEAVDELAQSHPASPLPPAAARGNQDRQCLP